MISQMQIDDLKQLIASAQEYLDNTKPQIGITEDKLTNAYQALEDAIDNLNSIVVPNSIVQAANAKARGE